MAETAAATVELEAVREELSLLLDFSSTSCVVGLSVEEGDDDDGGCFDDFDRFALRQPPPTGTLRRTPPFVQ